VVAELTEGPESRPGESPHARVFGGQRQVVVINGDWLRRYDSGEPQVLSRYWTMRVVVLCVDVVSFLFRDGQLAEGYSLVVNQLRQPIRIDAFLLAIPNRTC
jgi:hypothetical protein